MGDLISRQAAIEAMCELMHHWFGEDIKDEAREISRELGKLPSAQPDYDLSDYSDRLWKAAYERGKAEAEPRWIPVTERLPEKHEEVLATVAGEIVIAWLYVDGRWRSNDCPETYLNDHITAWLELPEPYRKETGYEL